MLEALEMGGKLLKYYNPWIGCEKVSMACDNCWYNKTNTILTKTEDPIPAVGKVFVCNRSDFFITQASKWRDKEWDKILRYSDAEFLFVTKRSENILRSLPASWGLISDRCSVAITVEHERYTNRLNSFKNLICANRIVFLCPLLSFVDLTSWKNCVDFVVISEDVQRLSGEELIKNQITHLEELNIKYSYLEG